MQINERIEHDCVLIENFKRDSEGKIKFLYQVSVKEEDFEDCILGT